MKKIFTDFFNSFNTDPSGWSARKLSAFFAVFVAGWVTYQHASDSNVVELSIVWLSFALLCLGLVTFGQLVQLRTGTTSKETKVTTETKSETTQP